MLNIFIGFEQCNKYTISMSILFPWKIMPISNEMSIDNEAGNTVGYIAEEEKGFLATISRQAFATHRPFRAVIMDASGSPILWVCNNQINAYVATIDLAYRSAGHSL